MSKLLTLLRLAFDCTSFDVLTFAHPPDLYAQVVVVDQHPAGRRGLLHVSACPRYHFECDRCVPPLRQLK